MRTTRLAHPGRAANAEEQRPRAALATTCNTNRGQILFQLRTDTTPALWPLTETGTFGSIITAGVANDNCEWHCGRCAGCGAWTLTATASSPIPAGALLHGPPPPLTIAPRSRDVDGWQVSFDGGARHRSDTTTLDSRGPRAAGAGAALWGPCDERGRRRCVAQVTVALPHLSDSMSAEAVGLRCAISLRRAITDGASSTTIVGDNLPILRLAATTGRLRADPIWQIVEDPVLHTLDHRWQCRWVAVRRMFNKLADRLATRGTLSAVDCRGRNDATPHVWAWVDPAHAAHFSLPTNPRLPWLQEWPTTWLEQAPCPLADTDD